ncbi:bifunctional precorrin-2 dehydrogenase/sirohydrochlorin ferrochelatase MET8 SCDLUD_000971 [Saccharomycodes ludwigii]|uniref:bifunctional precorrin-2 dehydrogenase/sirohydrochlorin ferrochelatase MET8 n=1 Tax=Saccharomycodes ludwigii TaxID=36035 RepID=UPI001E8A33FE|nr:hypothetical protein SCDLUD_000971 [Saccharomycodes ludwigii]KAH3903345.1 hypothetical protein SCDLUD_000971 [Saccharomycodes ludwigii]
MNNNTRVVLSLPVATRLCGKKVLLVGSGEVAISRLEKLIPTGCQIYLVTGDIEDDLDDITCTSSGNKRFETILKKWFVPPSKLGNAKITATGTSNDDIYTYPNWHTNCGKIYQIIKRNFKFQDLTMFMNSTSNKNTSSINKSEFSALVERTNDINLLKSYLGDNWQVILVCIDDIKLSELIYYKAKLLLGPQIMINVADVPPLCDFYFGSNFTLGEVPTVDTDAIRISDIDINSNNSSDDITLDNISCVPCIQILISSNGLSPRFTSLLKNDIISKYGSSSNIHIQESCVKLGELRRRIRDINNTNSDNSNGGKELISYRMQWIKYVTDQFGVKYCHLMDVDNLVKLYKKMLIDDSMSLEFPANMVQAFGNLSP